MPQKFGLYGIDGNILNLMCVVCTIISFWFHVSLQKVQLLLSIFVLIGTVYVRNVHVDNRSCKTAIIHDLHTCVYV